MKLKTLTYLCLVFLSTTITFSAQANDLSILSSTDTNDLRVLIRKIDDGEILWAKKYQLGTEAKISPGSHNVSIICEFQYSWGKKLIPAQLSIEVLAGKKYLLTGSESSDGKSCIITATENTY